MHEALEDAGNSNMVFQAELEEAAKALKAVEDKAARLEAERKEYDRLITQTDAHAFRKLLPFPFSDFCLQAFFFRLHFLSVVFPSGCIFFRLPFLSLFLSLRRPLPGLPGVRHKEG